MSKNDDCLAINSECAEFSVKNDQTQDKKVKKEPMVIHRDDKILVFSKTQSKILQTVILPSGNVLIIEKNFEHPLSELF